MTIAHRGELQRDRQLLQHQLEHRLLYAQRLAEVAAQHAADPVEVADRQRLVEIELRAQRLDRRGSRSRRRETIAGSPGRSCCSPKTSIDTGSASG